MSIAAKIVTLFSAIFIKRQKRNKNRSQLISK